MTRLRSLLSLGLICLGAILPLAPALASPSDPLGHELQPAPLWADLSSAERSALAPLQNSFNGLDAQQRRKWRAFAPRFERMDPRQKQNAHSKMQKWSLMTPEERLAARAQARRDREARRPNRQGSWEKWRRLSESEREALGNKAAGETR